jgi:hypothetical protein
MIFTLLATNTLVINVSYAVFLTQLRCRVLCFGRRVPRLITSAATIETRPVCFPLYVLHIEVNVVRHLRSGCLMPLGDEMRFPW